MTAIGDISRTAQQLVERVAGRNARILLVEGPAGAGKTTAVQHVVAAGRARQHTVLLARGSRAEQAVPLGMVRQLFESASPARHSPEASAPALALGPLYGEGGSWEAHRHYFQLLRGAAQRAGNTTGALILAIDDAHLADPLSLEWFGYAARRIDPLPVLLVLAHQSSPATAAAAADLAAHPATTQLALCPLAPHEVHELIARSNPARADQQFTSYVHGLTSGNQQLTSELIARLAAQRVPPALEHRSEVDRAFAAVLFEAVTQRLHRQPSRLAEVAAAIATLGGNTEPDLVAEYVGCSVYELQAAIAVLRELQVLGRSGHLAFSHPAALAAALALQPSEMRAAGRAKAARLLHGRGAPSAQVARQLEHAPSLGEPWIPDVLRAAAWERFAEGDGSGSLRLLRRAMIEPLDGAERINVFVDLTVAQTMTGSGGKPPQLGDTLRLAHSPLERALVVARLSHTQHRAHGPCETVAALVRCIEELSALPGEAEREACARLQAQVVFHAHCCPNTLAAAQQVVREFDRGRVARASGEQQVAAAVLLFDATAINRDAGQVRVAMRQLLANGFRPDEGRMPYYLLSVATMVIAGDFDTAEDLLARCSEAISGCGHAALIEGLYRHVESTLLLHTGRLAEAGRAAEAAVRLLRAADPQDLVLSAATAQWVDCLLETGRDEAAEEVMRSFSGAPESVSWARGAVLTMRARWRLRAGDVDGALADLAECTQNTDAWPFANPGMLPSRSETARALARAGQAQPAAALAQEELALARKWGAPHVVASALRALADVVGGEEGVALLREAVGLTRDTRARLATAHTLVQLGLAEHRAGRAEEARRALREGLDLAESCDAAPLAARAYAELVATGARPRRLRSTGPAALTPTERQVAKLAARGDSNREIAARLFVSQRAVEKSLTSVYRKLGITGRLQLPGLLGAGVQHEQAEPDAVPA